jgi:hypothetical protein
MAKIDNSLNSSKISYIIYPLNSETSETGHFMAIKETGSKTESWGNTVSVDFSGAGWKKILKDWGTANPDSPFLIKNYDTKSIKSERKKLVEEWRDSPAEIHYYWGGKYNDSKNNPHEFTSGSRLFVGEKKNEVMDTCQRPWCESTVYGLFNGFTGSLAPLEEKEPVCLLRGFGQGEQAQIILNELMVRGRGELHIIELNNDIVETMQEFLAESHKIILPKFRYGLQTKIQITIHIGDAYQITENFLEEGKKFDVIISDTYPLSSEESSLNDILDIENQVKCLKPHGRFSFFAYSRDHLPNATGLTDEQRKRIDPHFETVLVKNYVAQIDDPLKGIGVPPDYKFLQMEDGPVKFLPVVICTDPKLPKT